MSRFSLVQQAHAFIEAVVEPGNTVIDATVGNGHDTLFLARLVGRQGKVYGFDIQQAALDAAWQRLEQAGETVQVSLYHAGHEAMSLMIPSSYQSRVKAVMFNLGYLPGSDKMKITRESTTLAALQSAIAYLSPGGRISVLAYTGHPGGREEAETVKAWAATLNRALFRTEVLLPPDAGAYTPELLMIERQEENGGGNMSIPGLERWDFTKNGEPSEELLRRRLESMGYHVSCYVYPPGTLFPPHTHSVDKIDVVLSGRFQMVMHGQAVILERGDWLVVPRGAVHSAEVLGDEAVVSLDAIRY